MRTAPKAATFIPMRILLVPASLLALAAAHPAAAQDVPTTPERLPPRPNIVVDPEALSPPLIVDGAGAAPASAPTIEAIPRVWSPAPRDGQGRSAYGLYLSGRSALSAGESAEGADLLARVESLTPEQPIVREQAFTSALLAGDLNLAARISPTDEGVSPVISEAGALVSVIQNLVAGDARAANAALAARPIGAPHARAGTLIAPWVAAAAGDWDTALAEPNPTADPLTVVLGRYDRARLLEHRRRYDEADAALKTLAEDARTGPLFRVAYGNFLERRGRRDEALAVYDAGLAAGAGDLALTAARARVAAGGRAPELPSFREGAAEALTIAAQQASAEGANEFAVVYLRLSLNLDRDPASLYRLGSTLSQANLEGPAQATLEQVSDEDPSVYAASRVALGLTLDKADKPEEALAAYRQAEAATPTDPRIAGLIASQLMKLERWEPALDVLNGPLLNTADQSANVRFMRGVAYESLDRVPEAEGELWAALQAEPNEPSFLNYLGYLWVDKGTRVAEGAAMIQRAHAADPEDGNIQDSLGWAQYRQGQYDIAVDTLEQAVAKEPANAEINDHLGDAYWQVGRRREAGFQWNRVLTLDPDAERRAEVEKKLEQGLTDVPPSTGG
ncbi:TPR repeat-containing protein [Brevundimonas subvibrioides ATCC 15264]|uniref:TPR repeat-containing protein n=2 Tax=Brevundimonas subvibrioides TaxID=74313 RepID=D9QMS6_BRESC|nr:TPR repeat-containing protein [Brevundimonas subvibrioides ATCC 15264]